MKCFCMYSLFQISIYLMSTKEAKDWTDPVLVPGEFSKEEYILSTWKLMTCKVSRISRLFK